MRKFRFWLSRLIFEKMGRREPAQQKGQRIAEEVKKWNDKYSVCCHECDSKEFTQYKRGSEGLLTYPTVVYRCTKCGNAQTKKGLGKYSSEELGRVRIVEDGDDQYRYAVLTPVQWAIVLELGLIGFAIGFVVLVNMLC